MNVPIVYAADSKQVPGLNASLQSLVATASNSCLLRMQVHVFLPHDVNLHSYNAHGVTVSVHYMNLSRWEGDVIVHGKLSTFGDLSSPSNYARYFLPYLLEKSLSKVIYLDADTLVQNSICLLFDQMKYSMTSVGIAAIPRRTGCLIHKKPHTMAVRMRQLKAGTFNAGVILINLEYWRRVDVPSTILSMVKENNHRVLWPIGSNPPLCYFFVGRFERVNQQWNTKDLGFKSSFNISFLQKASILHWNGPRKPWLEHGLYKSYWQAFTHSM